MTTRTSAPAAASATDPARFTPSALSEATRAASMSYAVISWPARATLRAIGRPIAPRPTHPTPVIAISPFRLASRAGGGWVCGVRGGRRPRRASGAASPDQVDHIAESVLVADVAGEHDVRDADRLGGGFDRTEHRDHAGQQLADDLGATDAQSPDRYVVGGDAALGDHPGRLGGEGAADHVDDGGGDVAGNGQAVVGVAAADQ